MSDADELLEDMIRGDASTDLSSHRTAMSFDRTALASDRTLMAMLRTSLALIGFGFTIFQFFHTLQDKYELAVPSGAPRRFGFSLILLGVILLVIGILNHRRESLARRKRRQRLFEMNLIHHPELEKINGTMVVAILLLLLGLLAILRVGVGVGPF